MPSRSRNRVHPCVDVKGCQLFDNEGVPIHVGDLLIGQISGAVYRAMSVEEAKESCSHIGWLLNDNLRYCIDVDDPQSVTSPKNCTLMAKYKVGRVRHAK